MDDTAHDGAPAPAPAAAAETADILPHSGMVAVVGRANVGKSTLVNRLVGEKVSIVSPIVQTTRNVIRGILTEPRGQIVFLDTPGVHRPQGNLGKILNSAARSSVEGTDLMLLVLDRSQQPAPEDEGWMRRAATGETPCAMALNKCDAAADFSAAYADMWRRVLAEKGLGDGGAPRFAVSAARGDGVGGLLSRLFELMPPGPALFPPDMLTDYPRRINMADIIREKFLPHLRDELPHALAVWVEDVNEGEDGRWTVSGRVYVQKSSQKPIVLGAKGRTIRAAQAAAARELSQMYERPVDVRLHLSVSKGWDGNYWILRQLGYVQ
jgi:GTP-binding protein Era